MTTTTFMFCIPGYGWCGVGPKTGHKIMKQQEGRGYPPPPQWGEIPQEYAEGVTAWYRYARECRKVSKAHMERWTWIQDYAWRVLDGSPMADGDSVSPRKESLRAAESLCPLPNPQPPPKPRWVFG